MTVRLPAKNKKVVEPETYMAFTRLKMTNDKVLVVALCLGA